MELSVQVNRLEVIPLADSGCDPKEAMTLVGRSLAGPSYPLTSGPGVPVYSAEAMTEYCSHYYDRIVNLGLSVVALNDAGKVVGIVLVDDLALPNMPLSEVLKDPMLAPMAEACALETTTFESGIDTTQLTAGHTAYVSYVAVDPSTRNTGCFKDMMALVDQLIPEHGYQRSVSVATSEFSRKGFSRYGYEEMSRVPYSQFVYVDPLSGSQYKPYVGVCAPHVAAVLMAKDYSDEEFPERDL